MYSSLGLSGELGYVGDPLVVPSKISIESEQGSLSVQRKNMIYQKLTNGFIALGGRSSR